MARINPNQKKSNLSGIMLPIIITIIVLILIVRILFGNGDNNTTKNQSSGLVNVNSNQEKSEIYIYMSGDSKKQIDGITKMYSTDNKLEVADGEAKITFEDNSSKIYVNKLGELRYNGKKGNINNFEINNGDIWVEGESELSFSLKNFDITASKGVYSFTQYQSSSSVYVMKGDVNLKLNNGKKDEKSINIGVGQKITILNSDMTDSSLNIMEKIEPIDDYYKSLDFFAKHNGQTYLNLGNDTINGSGSSETSQSGTNNSKGQKVLIINYPEDEETVESNTINIEGKIVSSKIEKITLNDKDASINSEEKTFIIKDFELLDTINNLVYKAYDSEGNILTKGVLTIYTTSKEKAKEEAQKPTVTTYPISSKDFRIIEPASNPYKTTDNIVKIAGNINKGIVKFITINDFRLTKFPQFSSNWYYFANKDYGTMNDGINLYTIKYYGKEDELLYESLFTIVKENATIDETNVENSNEVNTGSITSSGISDNS